MRMARFPIHETLVSSFNRLSASPASGGLGSLSTDLDKGSAAKASRAFPRRKRP